MGGARILWSPRVVDKVLVHNLPPFQAEEGKQHLQRSPQYNDEKSKKRPHRQPSDLTKRFTLKPW